MLFLYSPGNDLEATNSTIKQGFLALQTQQIGS